MACTAVTTVLAGHARQQTENKLAALRLADSEKGKITSSAEEIQKGQEFMAFSIVVFGALSMALGIAGAALDDKPLSSMGEMLGQGATVANHIKQGELVVRETEKDDHLTKRQTEQKRQDNADQEQQNTNSLARELPSKTTQSAEMIITAQLS